MLYIDWGKKENPICMKMSDGFLFICVALPLRVVR